MLLLDNIIFELQRVGGVSSVWKSIIGAVSKDAKLNAKYLKSSKGQSCCGKGIDSSKIIEDLNIPLFIRRYLRVHYRKDIKLFHSSYFRVHASPAVKNVVTVHDFVYEKYDTGIRKIIHLMQKKFALKHADAIICVSYNTKKDLLHYHPQLDSNKVHIVHNGVDNSFYPLTDRKADGELYVLYVGGRNIHKNFSAVLDLLSSDTALDMGLKLKVVGGGALSIDELNAIRKLKLLDCVRHFDRVDTSELNRLYNNAFAFIYPSYYEGFGIPPLEAMAAGCPVICSNRSSIPEVVGSAGLLFDPDCIVEAEAHLHRLKSESFRLEIIERGFARAASFTWEKTGQKTISIYKKLLEEK